MTWQNQQNECAPSEDSDQPGHPPSLIRVFNVRMKKPRVLSYSLSAQRRLWSDWADAQADLSLLWAHTHFVGFVMSRLTCYSDPMLQQWGNGCDLDLWHDRHNITLHEAKFKTQSTSKLLKRTKTKTKENSLWKCLCVVFVCDFSCYMYFKLC